MSEVRTEALAVEGRANGNVRGEQQGISIQKIIGMALAWWPLFIAFLLASLLIAYLYLRYTIPQYKINAKVLVQDDKKGGAQDGAFLEELGLDGKSNVDNEVEIFKSRTLMQRVVRALNLNQTVTTHGRFRANEQFQNTPFQMLAQSVEEDSLKSKRFAIKLEKIDSRHFLITAANKRYKGTW